MFFSPHDMLLVHDPPKSPAYEQERRQKGPLQPEVAKTDQGKGRGGRASEGSVGPLMVKVQRETGLM